MAKKEESKKESGKTSSLLLQHDRSFLDRGFLSLAGVDEAGRGPLAGPVVASAVIVRDFSFVSRIDDSKKLSALQRERAFEEINAKCEVAVCVVDHERIDRVNILKATLEAMREAVLKLGTLPACLLVDGPHVPELRCTRFPVIDGDAKSFSIACASIVAKVTRDRLMQDYEKQYPGYGFGKHKGYGTKQHVAAIREKGPCKIHRKSFEPIKSFYKGSYGNTVNY